MRSRSASSSGAQPRVDLLGAQLVVSRDVPHFGSPQVLVALIHLLAGPREQRLGLLHVDNHGVHQVRDPLVLRELDLLGIDQDQLHLVGPPGHQDRQDHRVQADRLAGAGPAGHQKVGHFGQVVHERHALGVLAQEQRDAAVVESPVHPRDDIAQPDHVAVVVGHLDADRRLARDRCDDPDARDRQGDRQVVGQADDLRDAQAGLELDLELGDDRPGVDLHHAAPGNRSRAGSARAAWHGYGSWPRAPGSGRRRAARADPLAAT